MILNTPMVCNKCKATIKIKATEEFVSLKCYCNCTVHYPSGEISAVPVEKYDKNHKGGING